MSPPGPLASSNLARSALIAGLCAAAAPAWADEVDDRIEEIAAKAHADYLTGQYEAAASKLLEAYRLRPVPKLLFNAAKAYEKGEMAAMAAKHYRLFLSQADSSDPLVPKAQEALAGLPGAVPPPPPAEEPPAEHDRVRPSRSGRAKAAFGLAAAAAVAGTAFGLMALSSHGDFESETAITERRELRDAARQQALVADISWVLAAAAGVTGVVLWARADEPDAAAAGVGIGPGGAWLRGRW